MKYNRKGLRKLINALTKREFDESLDDFPSVYQQFTNGQEQHVRVNIVLEYLEKHQEEFPKLLEAIRERNLTAYNNYNNYVLESVKQEKADLGEQIQQKITANPPLQKSFEFEVVTVNAQGKIINREQRQAQYYDEDLGNGITLEMVAIPGGKFMMGSPEREGYDYERPQHEVTVQPFFMGKYPVTQAQWKAVAALPRIDRDLKLDPSYFKGDNRPVECVSWYDVVEFCARLSKASEKNYRLPSEAEWEYACRAGTVTPFHFGATLTTELANYYLEAAKGEDRQETTPVGSFYGNAFGLFDMHGNVWEWCADSWHENYLKAPTDGSAWIHETDNDNQVITGIGTRLGNLWKSIMVQRDNDNQIDFGRRLLRGGSWIYLPGLCRSADRNCNSPVNDNYRLGFRVVCGAASRT